MARYLAAETLRAAVDRLGESRAQGAVGDLLVFKRALVNTRREKRDAGDVATGLDSKPFTSAIDELARCAPEGSNVAWAGQPYFSPFGWKRNKEHGFKGPKYPSNGPSDTVAGWQSRDAAPLQLVARSSPKRYQFAERTQDELNGFFIKGGDGQLPTLLDVARWWFRASDLDRRFGRAPTARELGDAFVADLALAREELAALFEPLSPTEAEGPAGAFHPVVADPLGYLPPSSSTAPRRASRSPIGGALDLEKKVEQVGAFIAAKGFVFDPWQVAAFVTAVRTKPFVILAGISGTGKTKLPRLVAEATGSEIEIIPVRPDWTDGSDLVGYQRIDGKFVPGRLLQLARRAQENPERQFFALLDEMNIARVEYYLAEVLSHIEERSRDGERLCSRPLVPHVDDPVWSAVCLPSNLCLVGSVNMDETTHGFSRKVLDRSFVIEFSEVDLTRIGDADETAPAPTPWTARDWRQSYLTLAEHPERGGPVVGTVIETLASINDALAPAQLQVGYRVRDEIALFCLHAQDCGSSFRSADAGSVDPLDLAITMKILPRIQGGGVAIQAVLDGLRRWATPDASEVAAASRRRAVPLCQDRIDLMHERLRGGFTSYWL